MTTASSDQPVTLRVGIASSSRGDVTSLWTRCAPGTTWSDLRSALLDHGIQVPARAYTGHDEIRPDAVVGQRPLLHGCVIVDRPAPPPPKGLLELVVTEGPDTGTRRTVTTGATTIGRDQGATVRLRDADVSRRHCTVTQDQGLLTIRDDGSTNGTRLDGDPVPSSHGIPLRLGGRVRIGRSTLMLSRRPRARTPPCDDRGHLLMHRAPRRVYPPAPQTITAPNDPRDTTKRSIPWAMILLPLVMALIMVLVFHNTMFLMFALLSPAMVLGGHISDRRSHRVGRRSAVRDYQRDLVRFQQGLDEMLSLEIAALRCSYPTLTDLHDITRTLDDRMWQREPFHEDFLTWRVGTGSVDSRCVVRRSGQEEHHVLDDAPVTVSLLQHPVTGVCGDPALVGLLATSFVLQVAVLHSPRRVRLVVLCDSESRARQWRWLIGLPHVTSAHRARILVVEPESPEVKELAHGLSRSADDPRPGDDPAPDTVLLLDPGSVSSDSPVLADLVSDATRHGLRVVALAEHRESLPHTCSAIVEISGSHQVMLTEDGRRRTATPDLPSAPLALGTVRKLTQIVDATADSGSTAIPDELDLVPWLRSAHDLDLCRSTDVRRRWAAPASTAIDIGIGNDGPQSIDLAADGPHALVAGTTGSGKSELLQSLIVSLAAANRPDQLTFVLIDYKGGAAFKDCARLPHTVGLVTDLDGHLTSRALRSLEAELRRRESLLADDGAKDITDYTGGTPLPRLVLVIDEFRVLAEELPDFIDGLVRIATVGRSLGIHLVLATQRPAGVVSPEIRANVNLRVALRVRDDADSQDVIGSNRAAQISSRQPGRAFLRTGGSTAVEFQTARIGGVSCSAEGSSVVVAPDDPLTGAPMWPADRLTAESTDLQRVTDAMIAAWEECGETSPTSPWLPPLPHSIATRELPPNQVTLGGTTMDGALRGWSFGLLDLPAEQRIVSACWHPDTDGQLAVIGGPRSGRTTTLRTVAAQACRMSTPDELHLYVLDATNSLGELSSLPHCGAHAGRDDAGIVSRMCTWLLDEIRRRQALFAERQVGAFAEYTPPRDDSLARILLLVDGWETFDEVSDEATGGRLLDDLCQVIRDGAGVGIAAAVTGGRALTGSRVGALFTSRVALRMADETDLLMIGLRSNQVPETMPHGRALLVPGATEVHVATIGGDPAPSAQSAQIRALAQQTRPTTRPLRTFRALPQRCTYAEVRACDPDTVPLGLGGDDLRAVGFPSPAGGPLVALVAGPARSGRTTALVAAAHGLAPTVPTAYVGHADTRAWPESVTVLEATNPKALGSWLSDHEQAALLVDDLDQLIGSPTEEVLLQHLTRMRTAGGALIGAGTTAHLDGMFRGLVPELRRHQTGLLLRPGRHDGDLLGIGIGPLDRPRPGHGLLVVSGRPTEIQVAH